MAQQDRIVDLLWRVAQGGLLSVTGANYVAQIAIQLILHRARRGVDVNGAPFAPYSTKSRASVKASPRGKTIRSAKNLVKKLGAGRATKSGYVIFPNWGEYKRALGRSNVDLAGKDYRMHNSVQASVGGRRIKQGNMAVGSKIVRDFSVGIYDPKIAVYAKAHNEGARTGRNWKTKLPKREWFTLNRAELQALGQHAIDWVIAEQTAPIGSGRTFIGLRKAG